MLLKISPDIKLNKRRAAVSVGVLPGLTTRLDLYMANKELFSPGSLEEPRVICKEM